MSRIAAFFDLDKTLLDTSSGNLYARFMYRRGEMRLRELARVGWWTVLSRLGILNMEEIIPRLLESARDADEADMRALCDEWFEEDVVPHIAPAGVARVAEHRDRGDVVAIVSASTQYVVRPMAAYLGIDGQYVCTRLESIEGRFTGRAVPPVCYGQGKVVWAERFAAEWDVDLAASYFYTDSISDLPLLERVGHPIAVNPDTRLRRLARARRWPVELFY
ncbi:MAG TPA: HAD family hydrolase [Anaerolineae bacterium]|nr:HAD family hydrolase [Anaerolineae bacterium]